MLTQDGKLASSYASDLGVNVLETERSACLHEFDILLLDHYVSFKDAIVEGNDARVRELCESMSGLALNEFDTCPLLSDSSKLQLISRYRPLLLICVDYMREDIACWLLQQGCDCAINDNMVISLNGRPTLFIIIIVIIIIRLINMQRVPQRIPYGT